MKRALSIAWLALLAAGAFAQGQPTPRPAATRAAPAPLVRGEVVEVDARERRITVSHERIPNLGMDAMTMEFLVPPGEPFPPLKPHDRIRFAAGWRGGEYLITRISVVKPAKRAPR